MSSIESKIRALATSAELPQKLAAALSADERSGLGRVHAEGAPGVQRAGGSAARRPQPPTRMSPELAYGRHAGPAPRTARAAAVLLLLFRRAGRWHLPLTERPDTLPHHGGQISLPGGAIEPGEASSEAAIRELNEELGFAAPIELLGRLTDCYVFASDFLVTPWVAAAVSEPDWRPHASEVQDVVELPLETLFDEQAIGRLTIERGPLVFHAPCVRVGKARVWGATCIILHELADVLRYLLETFE